MGSALFTTEVAVEPYLGATDLTGKEGCLVTLTGGVATLSASATVRAGGVILEGKVAAKKSSIGILGGMPGSVRLLTSGVIAKGASVQQAANETIVTDAGAGNNRVLVGIAMEDAAAGTLCRVCTQTPVYLT